MIVPFPAGGAVDIVARIVGNKLGPRLGQQIVIENRPGASGALGTEAVMRAAPDGYTFGIGTTSTHALAVTLNSKLPYDPCKDFAHLAMIGSAPYVLAVQPNLAARNVKELIAIAKKEPNKLTYASAGVASMAHLSGALFEQLADVVLTHVPYRSSAQSVSDMVGGRIDMQFGTIAPFLPQIRDGKVRALATTGSRRASVLPDVPTVDEAAVPGFDSALWMALFMPSNTPTAIVERMNKESNAVLAEVDVRRDLAAQGLEVEPGTSAELLARIEADIKRWQGVAKKIGLTPE
ncbi:MAG: tripartite tricarboxylate transporter substrate binding protein [Hyphomicrobiales bacterium]|nr:tripartite tricarboxylate transporter substrate binding protein [Hyphomicrobiales bacterium]